MDFGVTAVQSQVTVEPPVDSTKDSVAVSIVCSILVPLNASEAFSIKCSMDDRCDGAPYNGGSASFGKTPTIQLASSDYHSSIPLLVWPSRNNSQLLTMCSISCLGRSNLPGRPSLNNELLLTVRSRVIPYAGDFVDHKRVGNKTILVSSVARGLFSMSTEGGENVTVLGDATYRCRAGPYFHPTTTVSVGGIPCNVTYESPANITVQFPRIQQLFPLANGSREVEGYFPITITNPADSFAPVSVGLSCPPSCPGSTAPTNVHGGIFYAYLCDQYLTGAPCLDVGTAEQCAYGTGKYCTPCPTGAFCPGGFRLWCVCPLVARLQLLL